MSYRYPPESLPKTVSPPITWKDRLRYWLRVGLRGVFSPCVVIGVCVFIALFAPYLVCQPADLVPPVLFIFAWMATAVEVFALLCLVIRGLEKGCELLAGVVGDVWDWIQKKDRLER